MYIDIDNQVFKLLDPRITALKSAKLSIQQFVHMIRPNDWVVLVNGTVFALTQAEYLAVQQLPYTQILSKEQFQQLLKQLPQILTESDRAALQNIKEHKGKCSKCQYNKYKASATQIVEKYPQLLSKYELHTEKPAIIPYPECNGTIQPKVSHIFRKFFRQKHYQRKSCLDCVQKHISVAQTFRLLNMAYIKGNQTLQGYSQHFSMAIANMQEAFQECPHDCPQLRDLIMFCIGKSKNQGKIFLPLRNILYVIKLARAQTFMQEALDQNQADPSFDLQFTEDMLQRVRQLPQPFKKSLQEPLNRLIEVEYNETPQQRTLFQGYMGTIADLLVNIYPDISNVLRNRRLMFKAAPQLIQNTQYDCKDLKEAVQFVNVQENTSSEEGTAERA